MGQDYTARKAAKKGRKRNASRDGEGGGGAGGGRERKRKKNQPRRLCRGLCYQPPALTDEDREWDGTDGAGGNGYDSDIEHGNGGPAAAAKAAAAAAAAAAGYDSDDDGPSREHGGLFSAKTNELMRKQQQEKQQQQEEKQQQKQKQKQKQQPDKSKVALTTSVRLLDAAALATASKGAARGKPAKGAAAAGGDNSSGAGGEGNAAAAGAPPQPQQQQQPVPPALREYPPLITAAMGALGFPEPTPVQAAAWPPAAEGRDVLAVSEPGSGKTLAYLLPALMRAAAADGAGIDGGDAATPAPAALVLLPTRELALQVAKVARQVRAATRVACAAVYGGAPREPQLAALAAARPPLLVVATPGRLLDLADAGALSLSRVRCVVLDEADRMLALGFAPQLERLHGLLSLDSSGSGSGGGSGLDGAGLKQKKKQKQKHKEEAEAAAAPRPQVLLFTATMPAAVDAAAAAWLSASPSRVARVRVSAAPAAAISPTVTQAVHVCAEHKKPAKLLKHLAAVRASAAGARNPPRVLVFANRVKTVRFVAREVAKAGWRAEQLHGKRSQAEREAAIAAFRAGKAQVLVASDVAARGLDVRGLPYVVNYDFPATMEAYVHRAGRTGRLAAGGHAFSFFTRNRAALAPRLVELLAAHGQPVDPNLDALARAWQEAEQRLAAEGRALPTGGAGDGEDGDDDDEEEEGEGGGELGGGGGAGHVPEDLAEGLGPNAAAALAAKRQAGDFAAAAAAPPAKKPRAGAAAGDALLVPLAPQQQQQQAAAAAAAASAPPSFIPSPRFAGARPGYVFQRGPRGVGYYPDPRAPKQQRGAGKDAPPSKPAKKPPQQQQQQQAQKGGAPKPKLPPLPGTKAARRVAGRGGLSSSDDGSGSDGDDSDFGHNGFGNGGGAESDSSDSDSGGGKGVPRGLGQRQQQAGRRKPLPGRLRKKLAKDGGKKR